MYNTSANHPELFHPGENSQELNGAVFRRLAIFFEFGSIPIYSKYLTAYSYCITLTKLSSNSTGYY
jgi:hypothetical protein